MGSGSWWPARVCGHSPKPTRRGPRGGCPGLGVRAEGRGLSRLCSGPSLPSRYLTALGPHCPPAPAQGRLTPEPFPAALGGHATSPGSMSCLALAQPLGDRRPMASARAQSGALGAAGVGQPGSHHGQVWSVQSDGWHGRRRVSPGRGALGDREAQAGCGA